MIRHFFIWMTLLLTVGCASLKPTLPRDIDPAKFWAAQKEKRSSLETVSGKIGVLVDSEEVSARGRGAIASRLFGKRAVRLEVRDPLGKVQYLAILSGDTFSAYVLGRALEVHDDQAGRLYLKRSLGMDLSFLEIQELIVGLLPGASSEAGWKWERPRAPLPRLSKAGNIWVEVDPDLNEIREARWKDVHVSYSDFRPCCNSRNGAQNSDPMVMARRVVFKAESGRTGELQFDWTEVVPAVPFQEATFALPKVKGFKREELK